jgi:hypothetical protein
MTDLQNGDPRAMPALMALKEEITTAAICGTASMRARYVDEARVIVSLVDRLSA